MASSNGRSKRKVVAYERDLERYAKPSLPPADYEVKFAGLTEACHNARKVGADLLVVAFPQVLGDTYEELIESLARVAEAGLELAVAGREPPR